MKNQTSFSNFQLVELTSKSQIAIKGGSNTQEEEISLRVFESVDLATNF